MAQNPRRKTQNGICGSFCRGLNAVKAPLPNLSYLEPAGETGVLLPFRTKSNPPRTLRSSRGFVESLSKTLPLASLFKLETSSVKR